VLTVLPLAVLVTQALSTRWFYPQVVPTEWTTSDLGRVFQDAQTRTAVTTSLLVSLSAAALSLVLAVPAARALALGRVRGARTAIPLFLVPTVLPPVALAMGLNVALLRADLAGTNAAVIAAHLVATLPYAVLILAAALTRYDPAFEQQAAVLGAGPGSVLLRVFVPIALPALAVTAALAFIVSWGQYLLTFLPGGGSVITLPVLLLASANGGNPTATAALAVVAAVPPAIAILLVVRQLERAGSPGRG
jgi:putative spermidine/putrescine transport system permease protein